MNNKGHAPGLTVGVLVAILGLLILVGPFVLPLLIWDFCRPLAVVVELLWIGIVLYYYVKWAKNKGLYGLLPIFIYLLLVGITILIGRYL